MNVESGGEPKAPSDVTQGTRRTRRFQMELLDESSAEDRAAERSAARRVFRRYCIACGRSAELRLPDAAAGRCQHCNGTLLVEPAGPY